MSENIDPTIVAPEEDPTPETTGPEVPGTGEENWEGAFDLDD